MRVPQEIIDHIIDFIPEDKPTLKRCSLTSRAWIPRTRYHLFDDFSHHPHIPQSLTRSRELMALCSHPRATITLAGFKGHVIAWWSILSIFAGIPDAQHPKMAKTLFGKTSGLTIWQIALDELQKLMSWGAFTNLHSLTLSEMSFRSPTHLADILSAFEQLKSLQLECLRFEHFEGNPNLGYRPALPQNLSLLQIDWEREANSPGYLPHILKLFEGCISLRDLDIYVKDGETLAHLERFLEVRKSPINHCLLELPEVNSSEDPGVLPLNIFSRPHGPLFTIKGVLYDILELFPPQKSENSRASHVRTIVVEDWVCILSVESGLVIPDMSQLKELEELLITHPIFSSVTEVHLTLESQFSKDVLEAARNEDGAVESGSEPHRFMQKGVQFLKEQLSEFAGRDLLRVDFEYTVKPEPEQLAMQGYFEPLVEEAAAMALNDM
ncbi:hypothetical protein WG66_007910 [Moniliophthora roreri]|nr:hypothetical protein WG66_007910 [Moniliophthora roreri]